MLTTRTLLTALAVSTMSASAAFGQTINFDFGRNDGVNPAGTNLTLDTGWNNVSSNAGGAANRTTSIADLLDSTGASTGISASFTGTGGVASGAGADYLGPYPAVVAGMPATVISDSFFTSASSLIVITLSGLDLNKQYDFLAYGSRGNTGTLMLYEATGSNGTIQSAITSTLNNSTEAPTISGVFPNGLGQITFTADSDGVAGGALNVLQITASNNPNPPTGPFSVSLGQSANARTFNPGGPLPGDPRTDNNGGADANLIGAGDNFIENYSIYDWDLSALAGKDIIGDVTLNVSAGPDNNAAQSGNSSDTITVHELFASNEGWVEGNQTLSGNDNGTNNGSVSYLNRVQYNDDGGGNGDPPAGTTEAWKDAGGSDVANLLGAFDATPLGTVAGVDAADTLTFTIPEATFQDWVDNGFGGLVFHSQDGDASSTARFRLFGATFDLMFDDAGLDPADLDQDGDVDDADFGIAFAAFTGPNNGPSSNPAADLDGDGDVDDADFGIAFAAFTGPGGASVPEPASLALLGLGGLLVARRRRA